MNESASTSLGAAIGDALGEDVLSLRRVGGGDINEAAVVELGDGGHAFVKWHRRAPTGMFEAEARGLAWLAEPASLRVPEVLAVGHDDETETDFLVLELLETAPRAIDFDERLGRGLAALHHAGAPRFGFEEDNFIGRLPQSNALRDDWATFYRECRLEPQITRARGLLDRDLRRRLDALLDRLVDVVGPAEPPARLHGDLWSGNHLSDEAGLPALIDPAVYGGHREIDLAMMQLFGGFGSRVFAAYDEAFPLTEGWEDRVPLYQLYPLLVHVNLFGGGYLGSVDRALSRLGY